jgi:hypothetical protein
VGDLKLQEDPARDDRPCHAELREAGLACVDHVGSSGLAVVALITWCIQEEEDHAETVLGVERGGMAFFKYAETTRMHVLGRSTGQIGKQKWNPTA